MGGVWGRGAGEACGVWVQRRGVGAEEGCGCRGGEGGGVWGRGAVSRLNPKGVPKRGVHLEGVRISWFRKRSRRGNKYSRNSLLLLLLLLLFVCVCVCVCVCV